MSWAGVTVCTVLGYSAALSGTVGVTCFTAVLLEMFITQNGITGTAHNAYNPWI